MEIFAAIGAILVASHLTTKQNPQTTVPVMLERTRTMIKREHPLAEPAFQGIGWNKTMVTIPRV